MTILSAIGVLMLTLAVFPVAVGNISVDFPDSTQVSVELTLQDAQAEDLAYRMQQTVDRVRAALRLSPTTAPAEGTSIHPLVSKTGRVVGYAAVNRLTLPVNPGRAGSTLATVWAAAAPFRGLAAIVLSGSPRRVDASWDSQWLQLG